jgi:ribosomal protein L7/L12
VQATKHPKAPRERREINGIGLKECKSTVNIQKKTIIETLR